MSSVRLRFLGSGDAFSSGGRFQACLHLEGGGEPVLIDCGATALTALKRAGIDPSTIGWIALSHLHGDHFGGLPFLILDQQFSDRTTALVIAGPPGSRDRVNAACEALYPGSSTAQRPFETRFAAYEHATTCEVGPALVTPFEVIHGSGAPAYALRVEYGGRVIAYSGDTEWTDALIEAADGADVFVCECNFYDKQVPGHLAYTTLAAKRPEIDCERLVITHMSDEMLAHLDDAADVEAAHDGAIITV